MPANEAVTEELRFGQYSSGMGDATSKRRTIWNNAPLAISDFKNGLYSIGGVSKVFSDLWGPIQTFNVGGTAMAVVPGTGLTLSGDPDTFPDLAAATWILMQPLLWNAINPKGGFLIVMDALVNSSALKHSCTVAAFLDDNGNQTEAWGLETLFDHTYLINNFFTPSGLNGSILDGLTGNVMRRMAASLGPDTISLAVNGAFIGSAAAQATSTATTFRIQLSLVPGVAGASVLTATLEKITFYRPQSAVGVTALSV